LVTASADGSARVWDAGDGREIRAFNVIQAELLQGSFSPDGSEVLAVAQDIRISTVDDSYDDSNDSGPKRRVQVWDLATGASLDDRDFVDAASPDGTRSVKISSGGSASLKDTITGKTVQLSGHTGPVENATFSPDGSMIATASRDQTARVWSSTTRRWHRTRLVGVFAGHLRTVRSVAFSPDGRLLVTTAGGFSNADKTDNPARIWDVASRAPVAVLEGHDGAVLMAAFSRDGRRLVTASRDGTARTWDVATGRPGLVLHGHKDVVWSAVFSP